MEIQRFETMTRMSRIVVHRDTIYLCGQTAKNKDGDIQDQTRTTLEKIDALLAQVGSDKSKILSVTIYLANIGHFQQMNEIWDAWVPAGQAPARACVEARLASPDLLVEMSIVAAR
ncbi:MAG: RidA family protein [Anaerolineales bacterium]|nr:RidA family protein [Anaerolineales bacterium]